MSISRLLSLFVALIFVVGVVPAVHAGIATSQVVSNGQNLLDCFRQSPGSASPADIVASDWVARHAASVKPADTATSDWVARYAASLKPADTVASDWVARHAASVKAGNALSEC
jgi:hypothetical protein